MMDKRMDKFPYEFYGSTTGIYAEIYLPKKTVFQGTLYDSLTEALDLEIVKKHFRDPDVQSKLATLLKNYSFSRHYDKKTIDGFMQVFYGYSLYELDGVFIGENNRIYEERTQVLRLMFRPDLGQIQSGIDDSTIRSQVRRYLLGREPHGSPGFEKFQSEFSGEVVSYLEDWSKYVGLLIFGFIVFKICNRIVELAENDSMSWSDAEDEIWVTSLWNLAINRIVIDRSSK